jgi:hypothetical protein
MVLRKLVAFSLDRLHDLLTTRVVCKVALVALTVWLRRGATSEVVDSRRSCFSEQGLFAEQTAAGHFFPASPKR